MRSLFLAAAVALLLPGAALAQSFAGLGETGATFTVTVNPQYPAPYSRATLSFLSSSLDLTNAVLAVSVNGKSVYQGSVQPVAVTLGKAGSVSSVSATISSGGANYAQSLVIQPQDVVLVAEPVSSAPPLYLGKPSVPLEGTVRVVAMANLRDSKGKTFSPSSLSYAWTVDGTQIANSSGIGKMAVMVASPLQYRTRSVSVAISSPDGSLAGGAAVSLAPLDPTVRLYANDPLLGIRYDHALFDGYTIPGTESSLYAVPFSFPTTRGAPLVQWFLNGSAAQTGNSITLRPTGSGQGSAALSLVASAGDYTRATANLSLLFGAKPGTNFFGL